MTSRISLDVAVATALDFSDDYRIVEWCFSPIGVSIDCFMLFLIIKHTPKAMKEYRKYLLGVQLWMTFWDINMHLLIRPVFFFPYVASGCTGVITDLFSLGCHHQTGIMFLSLSGNFCALSMALVYRRNQMASPGRLKLTDTQLCALHFFGALFNLGDCLFFYLAGLDNDGPLVAEDPRLKLIQTVGYALTPALLIWFYIFMAVGAWILIFALLFVISIFCDLAKMKEALSAKTFEMQKNFSHTLLLQLTATLLFFLIPIGFSFSAMYFEIANIAVLQVVSWIPSFHSTIYTLILLVHTPVFRQTSLVLLRIRKDTTLRRTTLVEPSHEDSGKTSKTIC